MGFKETLSELSARANGHYPAGDVKVHRGFPSNRFCGLATESDEACFHIYRFGFGHFRSR